MGRRSSLKSTLLAVVALAAAVPLFIAGWLTWTVLSLPSVQFLRDTSASFGISVLDWEGESHPFTVGPRNPGWVSLDMVPDSLREAVVASEDFSFFTHKGVDWFEVREAIRLDLAKRRFVRGASTITQQLAKNLFLSRDKTFTRKVRELILARRLERSLSKERILELYLNVAEFGPMVYGVRAGSDYYFGREPRDLSIRESSLLAAVLPGPKVYNPFRRFDRVIERSDRVLRVMLKGSYISREQYETALAEIPTLKGMAAAGTDAKGPTDADLPEEVYDPLAEAEESAMDDTGSLTPEVAGADGDAGAEPLSGDPKDHDAGRSGTADASQSSFETGASVLVAGKTVYSGAGLEGVGISVQRREDGAWKTVGAARSGYHGDFVFRAPPGLYRLTADTAVRMGEREVLLRGVLDDLELEGVGKRLDQVVIILLPSP